MYLHPEQDSRAEDHEGHAAVTINGPLTSTGEVDAGMLRGPPEEIEMEDECDQHRLDWLEEKASKGQVQIAKSLLGTGYEVAILRKAGATTVDVYRGTLRDAIDGAMGDYA